MRGNQKFFKCNHCGNLIGLIADNGVPLVCCGEKMAELAPNTVEASAEKHLPAVTVSGNTVSVRVGGAPHPTDDGHHIAFVYLETEQGGQRKSVKIGAEPAVAFSLTDDAPVAAYAYCNLHGLWKAEINRGN
ncbi:MAG: desulfoferrodoxin [Oscillospiraceae bacterium]|jgi:superoxide reductase|nr:desulfoferrodoxin [Oscillospiraceae bacterium]